MTRGRFRRIGATLLAATVLAAGCDTAFLPGSSEPAQLYVLTPKSTYPEDLPMVDWQLTVELPIAQAGLNVARIALRRSPITLEYYARANWIDTAPIMVQTLLVESFENSGKIVSVGRQSISLRPDYVLITDLREFQAEYFTDGPPEIRVRLNAKLVKMPERVIIGTRTVQRPARSRGTDLESVIAAFNTALGRVLKEIVVWTLRTPAKRGE